MAPNERGLRILLGLQAVLSMAVGVWGLFWTKMLHIILGLHVDAGSTGIAHLVGAAMLAIAVAYALAAAQPHRNRAFLVPLFLVPLAIAVAMIANLAQGLVDFKIRAGAFAAYNLAYCLLYFRVYPRVVDAKPDAPRT